MKRVITGLALGLALLAWTGSARAVPTLDFNLDGNHPSNAMVTYAGGAAPLVGSNLSVDTVSGSDTPVVHAPVNITNGLLNFTTGNFVSNVVSMGVTTSTFNSGGSLTIMGDIGGGNETLLSGSFTSVSVVSLPGGQSKVLAAAHVSGVAADLAALFGLTGGIPPPPNYSGLVNFSFIVASGAVPPTAFAVKANDPTTGTLGSGDVTATPAAPEPSMLTLAGMGVVGMMLYGRRRAARRRRAA
jgi:hypothetical protein